MLPPVSDPQRGSGQGKAPFFSQPTQGHPEELGSGPAPGPACVGAGTELISIKGDSQLIQLPCKAEATFLNIKWVGF